MNINVHIDRLVLDGLPVTRSDKPVLQAEVEAELIRLLGAAGLNSALQTSGASPSVRAGNIQLAMNSNPSRLGQQIAEAVYRGIGNPNTPNDFKGR